MPQKFWVGPGGTAAVPTSGNWNSAGAWRTATGGTTTTTTPTTSDEAIFDNNSFNGLSITVTLTGATTVGSINASGITSGANGITFAGTSSLSITNNAGTGSGLDLPSSRFTWSQTGTCTFFGTGTIQTRGVILNCPLQINTSSAAITLNDNLTTTSTFTHQGGALTIGAYQVTCSTYSASTASVSSLTTSTGGGFTVTGNSGTVINFTKSAAQLTFPGTKPTFTLTASGTASGRTIIWSAVSFATSTSTMPGLKITNGADTVTFTGYATPTNTNWALFDCTGFTGNYTTTYNVGGYCYVYGTFIFPSTAGTLSNMSYVSLAATGNLEAKCPTTSFTIGSAGVYTQTGPLNAININSPGGGLLTLNNTGTITISGTTSGFDVPNTTFIGVVTFAGAGRLYISTPVVTSLTSLYLSGSSCYIVSSSFTAPITFSGSFNQITFSTFSSTQTVTATCASFTMGGTINIPSNSVINLNFAAGTSTDLQPSGTCVNAFTINLNIPATASAFVSGASSVGGDPNLVVTGSGGLNFTDISGNFFQAYLSSLDTTSYSGTSSISYRLYVKNSLSQSSSANVIDEVYLNSGATGTFTLNTPALAIFNGAASSQNINVTTSTLALNASGSFTSSQGVLFLNGCTINNYSSLVVSSPGTLNSGSSTINCLPGNINTPGQALNNVVLAGTTGASQITTSSIGTISNSVQPATVYFLSNVTFTNFNLNGTALNLVTVRGYFLTVRTLTKSSAWTLGSSTDSLNNTGLTFGSTGNNNYLDVSYINGVYVASNTGNFFFMF
jgi:hypothetical protein